MSHHNRRRASRLIAAVLVFGWAVSPLGAEMRIRSSVEVKRERQRGAGLLAQVGMSLLPFRIAPSKVEIVTTVARGQVRVDGAGAMLDLPLDTVLISRADGSTICLLPSRREYFALATPHPQLLEKFFTIEFRVQKRGPSDVLLGHETERVMSHLHITTVFPDNAPDTVWDERFGRMVDAATLQETAADRQRRLDLQDQRRRESASQDPLTIESWQSNGYGSVAATAATASSSTLSLATGGLMPVAERRFALRQRIVNLTHGYRVDSRVTAVETVEVDDAVFAIPADYREIATPTVTRPKR